jgi:exosortase
MRSFNSVYLVAALAHLPLLVGYIRINWAKGHYQFFPLLILVAAWLVLERVRAHVASTSGTKSNWPRTIRAGTENSNASANVFSKTLLLLGAIVLGFAAVVQSSFLVIPSLMILSASWILGRFGFGGFKAALPAWLLLLLAIPFPWNIDAILVNRMQFLASGLASWILDSLGQVHFREGLTLVTAKKQFFTEEACSGIRSLFSSLAALSIYGVINRYSFPRHLFNWIQVVLWVVVGNAIRIAVVVYVSDNWFEGIAAGAYHEFLGIVVFALIVALALSTDKAIDAVQPEVIDEFGFEEITTLDGIVEAKVPTTPRVPTTLARIGNWVSVVYFALVLIFGIRLAYAQNVYQPTAFRDSDLRTVNQDDLPSEIEGWKVVNFEHQSRPLTSLLSPSSYLWTLEKDSEKAVVSLDGPYHAFHDLSVCYRGLGWYVESNYDTLPSGKDVTTTTGPVSVLEMTKRKQEGIVLFSAIDRSGRLIDRSDAVSRTNSARKNLLMVFGMYDSQSDEKQIAKLPISQIQILYESSSKISTTRRFELDQLYEKVRSSLLDSSRFSGQND